MDTLIVKGKYKVIRILRTEEHYAACEAVDISDPGNGKVILNIYDGELIKPYIGYIEGLRHCADYIEMFLSDESAVAAFRYTEGKNIDTVFFMGHKVPALECFECADRLIEKAIAVSDYSPNVSCPLLMTDQLLYEKNQKDFKFLYMIVPLPEMNERELCLLLEDQLKKILVIRYDTPLQMRRFVRKMEGASFETVIRLSSVWHAERTQIREEIEALSEKGFLARIFDIIRINFRDFIEKRKNAKRKVEAK